MIRAYSCLSKEDLIKFEFIYFHTGGIVNNTLRPTIPNYCDIEWRTLMEQCWAPNPAVRPSFTEIASRLRIMSTAASQTKSPGHKASKWSKQILMLTSFSYLIPIYYWHGSIWCQESLQFFMSWVSCILLYQYFLWFKYCYTLNCIRRSLEWFFLFN
jgi:hypothetical protein